MKKSVIFGAIGAMLILLAAAVIWDSVRYVSGAQKRVAMADEEMRKHEERLVKLLEGSKDISPAVQIAITAYSTADGRAARHEAYDELVTSFRQTMSDDVDPTNPLDRRFMDDIAGAINRGEVAEKRYDEEMAAYQQVLGSFRGRVAQVISSQAREDLQPGS